MKNRYFSEQCEGSNYNIHMQSRAYYSQLEVALVHKLVYDFYCKYYTHVLSIYRRRWYLSAHAYDC